jgi:hypothetical protein
MRPAILVLIILKKGKFISLFYTRTMKKHEAIFIMALKKKKPQE